MKNTTATDVPEDFIKHIIKSERVNKRINFIKSLF